MRITADSIRSCMRAFGGAILAAAASAAMAQEGNGSPAVTIDAAGAVHVPAHTVPMSEFLSPAGRAYVTEHLQNMLRPELLVQDGGVPPLLAGYLKRQRELFAVDKRDTTIGGVHAYDYTPKDGISERNRDRVLINLHGGGFSGCWLRRARVDPGRGHGPHPRRELGLSARA